MKSKSPGSAALETIIFDEKLRILDEAPTLIDAFDSNGTLYFCNDRQAQMLGYQPASLVGESMSRIYTQSSTEALLEAIEGGNSENALPLDLDLRCSNGSTISVIGDWEAVHSDTGQPLYIVSKLFSQGRRRSDLAEENEILQCYSDLSKDAFWCIEFDEPIDIQLPRQEIVRQVFENRSHWRLCNAAISEMYGLPTGLSIESSPVSAFFQRRPANERFIHQLLDANLSLNGVAAIDIHSDNTPMLIENDVRGHVVHGQLKRLVGIVRKVPKERYIERYLSDRLDVTLDILNALPDPVGILDRDGRFLAINPVLAHLIETPPVTEGLKLQDIVEWRTDRHTSGRLDWPILKAPFVETVQLRLEGQAPRYCQMYVNATACNDLEDCFIVMFRESMSKETAK